MAFTDPDNIPAKVLLIGKNGKGKTGAHASLVVAGYQLRMLDLDKGVNILRSLLTDPHYPYARLVKEKGIDLNKAVSVIPVDIPMQMLTVEKSIGNNRTVRERILGPKNGGSYNRAIDSLQKWEEGDNKFGHIETWDENCVLSLDTFGTLSKMAYYYLQDLNGRLGARDEGYDYQRDIGGAQSMLTRLLEYLSSSIVKCNVVISTHVTWVDDTRGVAQSPDQLMRNNQATTPDGYPTAIGRALSPVMGKYFNDVFCVESSGSGSSVRREISTVPIGGIVTKNSAYLQPSYDIGSGLAEIFAALRRLPPPQDVIDICGRRERPAGAPRPGQPLQRAAAPPAPASA